MNDILFAPPFIVNYQEPPIDPPEEINLEKILKEIEYEGGEDVS